MKNITKQTKAILEQMPSLNSQDAESIRENMVRMTLLMGEFPYADFADDARLYTPETLWNMPEFQQIVETWESDCGRYRGAVLKAVYGFKLLATITDARTYIAYDWNTRCDNSMPLFTLTKEQIKELAA